MKRLIAAAFVSLVFCQPSSAEEIRIEGGGTAITTVFRPIQDRYQKIHGHSLSIVQSSAVKGLIALRDGKVDVATGAHPLEDLLAGAAKEGVIVDKTDLVATEVEDNRLVVIANRDSDTGTLSKEQLKAIFTGKITNWRDVGGKDIPVQVIWGTETKGQNIQFTRIALDGEQVKANARAVTTYRDIADTVRSTPGAIGVVPVHMSTPATRSIDTMSLTSPIYVITRGKPSPKVQTVINFYKSEYSFLR